MKRIICSKDKAEYAVYLAQSEKSSATIEKYCRDVQLFLDFVCGETVTKQVTVAYKNYLEKGDYTVSSINSMLAALNSFLRFKGWEECMVKSIRCQKKIYCAEERELTRDEYMRLLSASKNQEQINLIMQTICGTGIRISELKFFTIEDVRTGEISVKCKGKNRIIIIPGKLRKMLLSYAKKKCIQKGSIFVTRTGVPLDRSNIWSMMKKLCEKAGVNPKKVFPHNLRKLFAKTFYKLEKDIAKLADILGHGSIETTRIYIMTSGREHRRKIEKLGLVI